MCLCKHKMLQQPCVMSIKQQPLLSSSSKGCCFDSSLCSLLVGLDVGSAQQVSGKKGACVTAEKSSRYIFISSVMSGHALQVLLLCIELKKTLKCFIKMKGVVAMLAVLTNNICSELTLMHVNSGGRCQSALWAQPACSLVQLSSFI